MQGITRAAVAASALAIIATACSGGDSTFAATGSAIRPQTRVPAPSTQELYIANSRGGVLVYSTGANPALLQTITDGVPSPGGIWLDQRNTLYAVNVPIGSSQTRLPEYKFGASSPFRTITNGIVNCSNVAVDKHGKVFVAGADLSNGSFFLEIYPKDKLSPVQTLTIPHPSNSRISGLAFDSTGALLVGESVYFQQGVVYRLAPHSKNFVNLNLQNATGGTLAVDDAGNLYVGSGSSAGAQQINVYSAGSTSPSLEITVPNILAAIAVEPNGELYAETIGDGPPQISIYAPGSTSAMQTFDVKGGGGGVALSR